MFEGHQGPITGIHCHAAVGPVDFSHLFVTSSFDWTVKLWTTKVTEIDSSVVLFIILDTRWCYNVSYLRNFSELNANCVKPSRSIAVVWLIPGACFSVSYKEKTADKQN